MVKKISGPHAIFTLITRLSILRIWNIEYLRSFQILEQVSMAIRELNNLKPDSKLTHTAFTFDDPPTADNCVAPTALRAPGIVLKNVVDHKIDIWSFGCLIYEFVTGNVLFQVSGLTDIPQEENDDDHILQMIDTLGQPPPGIFAKWPRRARYFDKNFKLIRSDVSSSDVTESEPFRSQDQMEWRLQNALMCWACCEVYCSINLI